MLLEGIAVVLFAILARGPRIPRPMRRGAWRSSIQNGLFIVLYKLGVSPVRLHRWYYRDWRQDSAGSEERAASL